MMALHLVRGDDRDIDDSYAASLLRQWDHDRWDLRPLGYKVPTWARFAGRRDSNGLGATHISQPWLGAIAREWVFRGSLRQLSGSYMDDVVMGLALLSSSLRDRSDRGDDCLRLKRADISAFVIRVGRLRKAGTISDKGAARITRLVSMVLDEVHSGSIRQVRGFPVSLPPEFALRKSDLPRARPDSPDRASHALPHTVVRQLLSDSSLKQLASVGGPTAVNYVRIGLGTGRRPGELLSLRASNCLNYNLHHDSTGGHGQHAVLIHDMPKVGIIGYRLPIDALTASAISEQQNWVRQTFPQTIQDQLPLFPSIHNNPDGRTPINANQLGVILRKWLDRLPELLAPGTDQDGRAKPDQPAQPGRARAFPKNRIYLYAFRHSWAQNHADAGTPLEVLQDLMGHANPRTTQIYYRITSARRHEAVSRLARLRVDNLGQFVEAGTAAGSREESNRAIIGATAVPFGQCVEPANVQSGGHSCPYRMRCLGCSHFRTDPSYLPDLREYLTQLLVSRERLNTETGILESWAVESATPRPEEIERVRDLIRRCEESLATLMPAEREEIDGYISQLRRSRGSMGKAVPLTLSKTVRVSDPDFAPAGPEANALRAGRAAGATVR